MLVFLREVTVSTGKQGPTFRKQYILNYLPLDVAYTRRLNLEEPGCENLKQNVGNIHVFKICQYDLTVKCNLAHEIASLTLVEYK